VLAWGGPARRLDVQPMPVKETRSTCPYCGVGCGVIIQSEGAQITGVKGDPSHPANFGRLCSKGAALAWTATAGVTRQTRLLQPMQRLTRGQAPQALEWDAALDLASTRFAEIIQHHGPDAVGFYVSGQLLTEDYYVFNKLAKGLIGTNNIDTNSRLCMSSAVAGYKASLGADAPPACYEDLALAKTVFITGANMAWAHPVLFRRLEDARRADPSVKLIVADPRRTETAAVADAHHFIRPGADVFLLAAMVHTLFAENLVRLGAVQEWVTGVDEVRAAVAPFAPEAVAARCAIDADTIRALARQLAHTPRAAVYARIGTCTQEYGTLASWLVDVLNVLTGHLDAPGGAMFANAAAFSANSSGAAGRGKGIATGRRQSRVSGAPEVMGEFPISCIAEEIETPGPGQMRALITVATNPVLSVPDGPRLAKALDTLDFMVSLDIYLNETTRHADVILPGPSPLEDLHYDVAFPQMSWRNHARYSPPVFARAENQPEEWENLLRIAAIAQGLGAKVDIGALDDSQFAEDAQRSFGPHADAVIAATQGLRGPPPPPRARHPGAGGRPTRPSLALAGQPRGGDGPPPGRPQWRHPPAPGPGNAGQPARPQPAPDPRPEPLRQLARRHPRRPARSLVALRLRGRPQRTRPARRHRPAPPRQAPRLRRRRRQVHQRRARQPADRRGEDLKAPDEEPPQHGKPRSPPAAPHRSRPS